MGESLDPALQATFDDERRRLVRLRTVVACYLAMCIAPLYVVSDYFLYREELLAFAAWRLIGLLLTGGVLIAVRRPIGERHPDALGLLLGIEVGFMVSGVPVLMVGYDTPYYVGFVLVIFGGAVLMPWRMRQEAILAGTFVAMYAGGALIHGDIRSPALFLTNLSFVVTTGVVAAVCMRASTELRLREFSIRHAMAGALRHHSELAAALADKTGQLELVNQEMEDLLYVASHDLRAPLINVQGFARELQLGLDELRQAQPASPETRAVFADIDESIQFVLTAVARMDGLIGSLLNVSRIATRTNPIDVVPLGPMVDAIIDSFRYQLDQKQITVAIGDLPVVLGDPVRLNQAISNLVDNAIKYMGDRRVRRIEIGASAANGTCTCYVRDSGPGIPKADHERIFRLFHRLGNGAVPGEGIGLTMVRKIIEKHGGRIWLETAPDAGSTFWFTLRSVPTPAPKPEAIG